MHDLTHLPVDRWRRLERDFSNLKRKHRQKKTKCSKHIASNIFSDTLCKSVTQFSFAIQTCCRFYFFFTFSCTNSVLSISYGSHWIFHTATAMRWKSIRAHNGIIHRIHTGNGMRNMRKSKTSRNRITSSRWRLRLWRSSSEHFTRLQSTCRVHCAPSES